MDMNLLTEDGSLNIEYLSKLSPGKFMEIFPQLTPEQRKEYISQLPKRDGPVKPIIIDERFEAGMEEKHLRHGRDREPEEAFRIASMYLENHPRPEYYLVKLCSSTEDSEGRYYRALNKEEKDLFRIWEDGETGKSLDEFIKSANEELYSRLVSNRSLYALDTIQSCDLTDMRKYSSCQIRQYEKYEKDYRVYNSIFPLSDEEFCMLLAERISRYSGYTMNSLVVHHPDLAQKIMRHLICLTGMEGENYCPFMVIFTEIEKAFNDIIEHQETLDIKMRNYLGLRKILG